MPIEDAGVYHPRDYYKFQEGFGTADDLPGPGGQSASAGVEGVAGLRAARWLEPLSPGQRTSQWLAYEEDGSTLPYWCYDFNWPVAGLHGPGGAALCESVRGGRLSGRRGRRELDSQLESRDSLRPGEFCAASRRAEHAPMLPRGRRKELKPAEGGPIGRSAGRVRHGERCDLRFCRLLQRASRPAPVAAEEFVNRLRRWLHEQRYAKRLTCCAPAARRSHDSLRSQLWFGVEPARAMTAMTA